VDPAHEGEDAEMKRYVLVAVAVAAAAVIGASAARSNAAPSGSSISDLRIGLSNTFASLDFSKGGNSNAFFVAELTMQSLLVPGKGGALEPELATSWSQPTTSTWVFHLRHGVMFSDGTPFTATDVVNSINYWRFPGSPERGDYASVRSIKAVDSHTVRFTLKHPDVTLLSHLANFEGSIFEAKQQQAHETTFGQPGTLVVGTGPFVPVSLDPTSGVEYNANPHYWGGKVPVQHLSVKFISDPSAEALAMRSGAIDVAFFSGSPSTFATASGGNILTSTGCAESVFAMNTKTPPWNDVHVRRAVAYAINHQDVITAAGSAGYASPLYYLYPPALLKVLGSQADVSAALKSVPTYKSSLVKAKAELAKSSYPNGFSVALDEYSGFSAPAQAIAGDLAPIGIHLTVRAEEIGAYISAITGDASKRPTTYIGSGCSGVIDPSFYNFWVGSKGGFNIADYAPASFDALIDQSKTSANPRIRLGIYQKMLIALANDEPYVPLFTNSNTVAISNKFKWPTYDNNIVARPWAMEIRPK
jgi:peptide/nickel transport system substrate-binding protein